MKKYFAKANIGIFGHGLVTFGEILNKNQLDALGEERVAEMVREGALGVQEDAPSPPPIPMEEPPKPKDESQAETAEAEPEIEPEEGDEMPALDLKPDDVMGNPEGPDEDKPTKGGRGKKP